MYMEPIAPLPTPVGHQGCETDLPGQHPHRPMPDPHTGELKIDPDVIFRAKKFQLALSFYYSSQSTLNAEYGQSRSASVRSYAVSDTSSCVTVIRGDQRMFQFQ